MDHTRLGRPLNLLKADRGVMRSRIRLQQVFASKVELSLLGGMVTGVKRLFRPYRLSIMGALRGYCQAPNVETQDLASLHIRGLKGPEDVLDQCGILECCRRQNRLE